MGLVGTPSLDRVLIKSQNTTIQHMIIEGSDHVDKLHVKDNVGATIFQVDTVTPEVTVGPMKIVGDLIIWDPTETEFAIISRTLSGLDIDSGVGGDIVGIAAAGYTEILMLRNSYISFADDIRSSTPGAYDCGQALYPFGEGHINNIFGNTLTVYDTSKVESGKISRSLDYFIIKAGVGATGVLIEDGHLGFVGANKGRIIDDGSSLSILYGATPDRSFGLGCCSGGTYYIDIDDDSQGRMDVQFETFVMNDGAFFPTRNFVEILGLFRTSGHVLNVVGDLPILTTGDLVRVYNDGIGTGTDFVFAIDKNGVISVGDSTGVEHATIERTLTDFIFNTGAGGGLSIQIASSEVIGDNGVSALVFGNTTMAPQMPVLTTAQRNALTATQGMYIYHLGPPANAQVYSGVAWVNL